ncbi:TRAP transporter small permease [Salicibibacter cibarius]|uniref:TRAP transporter small permease n=1 Tax=Salicibibacter cibarius TaxID=2743000 RepID=A0A7T6Z485_9BACI|nr:TRAP transporter small permease [Salicibibacter cibarius]QQK76521.1 TRAP transporter small permease [Salicibibacter cibarius]
MKLLRWLDEHFEEYLLIILSCFTVIVIFSQVVMRYVLGASLPWSEEIARYAFIWMIYIGVSYGVKKHRHLGVDAFSMLFEKQGKVIIGVTANVCFLIFAVVITYYGLDIVVRITRESAALQIPMEWVYAAPVTGMVLTIIRLIQNLIEQLKTLRNPHGNNDKEQGQEEAI